MSRTSKSPLKVAATALAIAEDALPKYAHRFSPKIYTQPQLFACLSLKVFFKVDYRGIVEILKDSSKLCEVLGLQRVPHYTTLQKASCRLLRSSVARRLLSSSVARSMKRRKRVKLVAMDSTGLESQRSSRYYVKRRSREPNVWQTTTYKRFPKLGLVCDCSNHLILSVFCGQGPTPDVDQFRKTLSSVTEHVRIRHLVADAGYDSEANHRYAREACNIRTTIPPKLGRPTKKPPSGRYRRLMAGRFDKKSYGQRWQAETVISMLKRNLGSALSARSYWSKYREMNLFALTHNIMIILLLQGFLQSNPDPFSSEFAHATHRQQSTTVSFHFSVAECPRQGVSWVPWVSVAYPCLF